MAPLRIEKARKVFGSESRGGVVALDGVDLEVQQGQFVAIMGASGSGKSTLLHLMAGLTQPNGGSINIDDTDIGKLSDHALTLFRRRKIGLVFQSFNLIPTLTAAQNVALPLLLDGVSGAAARKRAGEMLDQLGLAKRADHRPDAMSGGEQQRVAIGRALITDPVIVLADEPTGNLDSGNSSRVCELLRDLSLMHGRTIIMVTHEPSVACYAQLVVVLRDGQIVDTFPVEGGGDELAARYRACLQQNTA